MLKRHFDSPVAWHEAKLARRHLCLIVNINSGHEDFEFQPTKLQNKLIFLIFTFRNTTGFEKGNES